MPGKIDGMKPPFIPAGGLSNIPSHKEIQPQAKKSEFSKILLEKLATDNRIKFSAHAQSRLQSRNIDLDSENISKLAQAMDRAHSKGAHDSLILLQDIGFIVNLDNRTVVTAIDNQSLKENIFTQIDSAVFVD